jgi:hypothetical protein
MASFDLDCSISCDKSLRIIEHDMETLLVIGDVVSNRLLYHVYPLGNFFTAMCFEGLWPYSLQNY